MARPLLRVGLTGGIATGKSTCLRHFAALGIPTIDSDAIARDLVQPGTPGLSAVVARFGAEVLSPDGTLDRSTLGRIVFRDEQARHDLENIIHPGVFAALQHWFAAEGERAEAQDPSLGTALAVADVPLLYEVGSEDAFDRVIVAACRPDQQIARAMARDGLTEVEAQQRIAAQWPIDAKAARADFVIDTSGTKDETERQVKEIVERLRR